MVFVGIVVGHAVLIYVMATRTTELQRDGEVEFSSLPVYISPLIEGPDAPRRARALPRTVKSQSSSTDSTAITVVEPPQVPDTQDTPPQVDWAQEATTVIREMTRPKSEPRQFGDRPKDEPTPDDRYIHPLIKPPAHRAGDIQVLGPGIERRWLGERCYMDFGQPPELFPAPGPRINPVRCMIGPSVDGHIFDHLKPEYLKQK